MKMETITSSIEDILLDTLSFKPSPGASYLLSKRSTRHFVSGSDSYSPSSGVTTLRWNLTGAVQEWMNPQSVRVQFDITNNDATHPLTSVTGLPASCFQRLSIRCLGSLVEDIQHYNRVYQIFHEGLTKEASNGKLIWALAERLRRTEALQQAP